MVVFPRPGVGRHSPGAAPQRGQALVLGLFFVFATAAVLLLMFNGGRTVDEKLRLTNAADACQRPVVTGPVEATAMGNLLVQVRASGELSSLAEMRQVIRRSSDVAVFKPGKAAAWEDASARFARLRRGN